jgi:uncharacterized iron-regulated membrane protein
LFVAVLGLTGTVIVFRSEFERAAMPRTSSAAAREQTTIDEAAREITQFRPGYSIRRVRLPVAAGDPFVFQIESHAAKTERIVVDSATGKVAGTLEASWLDWIVDLHHNFLAGKAGRKAVGIAGILLFVLSATGLVIWLRGSRNWRNWTTVRAGPAKRFHFELHRAAGLWAYVFLAMISFTGIGLAFPDTYRQAVQWVSGESTPLKPPKTAKAKRKGNTSRSLSDYLAASHAAMPDGTPVELRLAENGKSVVDVRMHRKEDWSPAANHVYLDAASGTVVSVERMMDRPLGARFLAALTAIHYAQIGGRPAQVVWSIFGLAPALLFVTGLLTWWRPTRNPIRKVESEVQREKALVG